MDFDEFQRRIDSVDKPNKFSRLGPFRVEIRNKGRRYDFHHLKMSASNNPDYMGFGLNKYIYIGLPALPSKRNRFFNLEYVDVDIAREEFIEATEIWPDKIILKMRTWTAFITCNYEFLPDLADSYQYWRKDK